MNQFDDELQRMEELEREEDQVFQEAISLDDPISSLEVSHPVTVPLGASIREVVEKLHEKSAGCVLVVKKDKLAGIMTERDILLKITGNGYDFDQIKVDDFMTPNPESLKMTDPVAFALNKMYVGGFRNVPIVDEAHRPVGLVGIKDIIRMIANYFAQEILNLPPEPEHQIADRPEGG
ncbi:MAG: CBS domain-containing protein [Candidatus Neomarinimicrobiota bacterium]|nr:MAG: CBS domain-containing protein [Candidatus Neomarinimicrobiota bacterium]